jgi:hypothetical protein
MTKPDLQLVNENYLVSLKEKAGRLPHGPKPPDNDDMEARVAKLEEFAQDTRDRLARIETRLDGFATKSDLHNELHALSWRLITWTTGVGAALSAAVYFIAKNVH